MSNADFEHELDKAGHTEASTSREADGVSKFEEHVEEEHELKSELGQQAEAAARDVESWFQREPQKTQAKMDSRVPDTALVDEVVVNVVEEEVIYEDPTTSVEERRIVDSVKTLDQRINEMAEVRQQIESRLLVKLETEAKLQAHASARRREEEQIRKRADEEAARRRQEDDLRLEAQRREVQQIERELRSAWEVERRLRGEVVRLKQLAHQAFLKRLHDEEEANLALLDEAQRSRNEAEERHVDSLAKLHNEEEYLRRAVEKFSVRRTEVDAERQKHEIEARKLEEEKMRIAAAEAVRNAERNRIRQEIEEKLRREQEQLKAEEDELARLTERLAQQRQELDQARQNAEEDARRIAESRARMEAAQEKTQQAERERLLLEAEIFQRAEVERRQLEETRLRAEEQRQQLESNARQRADMEARRIAELELLRCGAQSKLQDHSDRESLLSSEVESLRQTQQSTLQRIQELEEQGRAATESHLRLVDKLKRVEEELQNRAQQEAHTRAELERRIKEETEQLKLLELEYKQRIQEEIARRAEAESRVVLEKSRYQTERDARIKAELRADFGSVTPVTPDVHSVVAGAYQRQREDVLSEVVSIPVDGEETLVYQVGDLSHADPRRRADAVTALARLGSEDAYDLIIDCFDDDSSLVRNTAARAMMTLEPVRPAESFMHVLKDASDERKTRIGKAIAESGLATQALKALCSQDREETYNGLCLLFTMARTGEVEPLVNAIENHEDAEIRLAAIRLLKMSGQEELATEAVNRRLGPNKS